MRSKMYAMPYIWVIGFFLYWCGASMNTPYEVQCPSESLLRESNGHLCPNEEGYISAKRNYVSHRLFQYLKSKNDSFVLDPRLESKLKSESPILGLGISGGGYRSMITASGLIKKMDEEGIYECLSYISGLSGGSWVLLDLLIHDFNPNMLLKNWKLDDGLLEGVPEFEISNTDLVSEIHKGNTSGFRKKEFSGVYDFQFYYNDIDRFLSGEGQGPQKREVGNFTDRLKRIIISSKCSDNNISLAKFNLFKKILKFYINLHLQVRKKKIKGFYLSLTDYWGMALLHRLQPTIAEKLETTSLHGLMQLSSKFQSYEAPFPIFIANCKNNGLKNYIFEFTPYEFGSWETSANVFIKVDYLGSRIQGGRSHACFKEFDNIGFVAATSSSIFNNVILYLWQQLQQSSREMVDNAKMLLSIFGLGPIDTSYPNGNDSDIEVQTDFAIIKPNPFYLFKSSKITSSLTDEDYLYLVDGGEDGENIPLRTLLIPQRKLDLIFLMDSSSDQNNYADGTKLRNVLKQAKNTGIDYNISLDQAFSQSQLRKPMIFGCFMKKVGKVKPPLLIYYANVKHSFSSNTSTFKFTYNNTEINEMFQNSVNIFNSDSDLEYQRCLPCFIIMRSLEEVFGKSSYPDNYSLCNQCYRNFCYS